MQATCWLCQTIALIGQPTKEILLNETFSLFIRSERCEFPFRREQPRELRTSDKLDFPICHVFFDHTVGHTGFAGEKRRPSTKRMPVLMNVLYADCGETAPKPWQESFFSPRANGLIGWFALKNIHVNYWSLRSAQKAKESKCKISHSLFWLILGC